MATKFSLLTVKNQNLSFLGFLVTVSLIAGYGQSAYAEVPSSTPINPLEDVQNPNRGDIFSNRDGNQAGDMMNFIHQAIQGQGRSLDEYSQEQRDNLDTAAQEFRKQQQQRLGNQTQSPTPSSSTPAK
jgi:hypothetical protein